MSISRELIINGEHVPALSGRTAEDINPCTGEVFATVAAGGPEDVTRAVDAAASAAEERAGMAPSARRRIFLRAADLFEERLEEGAGILAQEVADSTNYDLTAGVITENPGEGIAVANRLRTGVVHVDDQSVADEPQVPFGGIQESGCGKFGGKAGVESFSERRWITVQELGHAGFPF